VTAHLLPHLAAFFAGDLPVLVRIGHVEVMQSGALSLLQGHAAVLVGVRHHEHVPAEAATSGPTLLNAVGTLGGSLPAQLGSSVEFRARDGSVAIGVEAREHLLATLGTVRSRGLGLCTSGTQRIDLGAGHLTVLICVEAGETLRGVTAASAVGTLGEALAALRMQRLHFRLGDRAVAISVNASEVLLHLGRHCSPRLGLADALSGSLCNGHCRNNGSCDAAGEELLHV
jgi:hypothetical protein